MRFSVMFFLWCGKLFYFKGNSFWDEAPLVQCYTMFSQEFAAWRWKQYVPRKQWLIVTLPVILIPAVRSSESHQKESFKTFFPSPPPPEQEICEMTVIGWGSFRLARFGTSGVEPSGSASTHLVQLQDVPQRSGLWGYDVDGAGWR